VNFYEFRDKGATLAEFARPIRDALIAKAEGALVF
jgi:hypothetical protein